MNHAEIRAMRKDDWAPAPIPAGSYSNPEPLSGYRRPDGLSGNALHPIHGDLDFEDRLAQAHAALRARYPGLHAQRHHVRLPYLTGHALPDESDYAFVDAPQPLTTTSISVLLVPQAQLRDASLGFYFAGDHLPSLRQHLAGRPFQGLAGNLGYYMTAALIGNDPRVAKAWAHARRYPDHPLPTLLSYIGFSLFADPETGQANCTFHGAHPGTVGVCHSGKVEILPRLEIDGYQVILGGQTLAVSAIDDPNAAHANITLWTPALRTTEIQALIAETESSAGAATSWQRCAPTVPLADRIHVFVANEGDGRRPVSKVVAVWKAFAPVPSFGGVLSFTRARFRQLYGSIDAFRRDVLGSSVQITPIGKTPFDQYPQMLGGLVPAVVDGRHVLCAESVPGVMQALTQYGNANSPLAQAGRESRNFDPTIREPAGVLVQTMDQVGWVLLDGRHAASIGAGVVDVALLLHKMEQEGLLPPIQQAVFIDGGSAMKAYHVQSDGETVHLDLLNRVAAGSRNPPGADPDGLNLYTLLALSLVDQ